MKTGISFEHTSKDLHILFRRSYGSKVPQGGVHEKFRLMREVIYVLLLPTFFEVLVLGWAEEGEQRLR